MIDCNVINDLIFVYVAGEASPQTEQLVETHLTTCPDCAKAIERARLAEATLVEWDRPKEKPINGRHFIGRLQKTFFVVITTLLLLFTFGWAIWHHFVLFDIINMEAIYIQIPIRLFGWEVWLLVAVMLLAVGWQWWQHRRISLKPKPGWYEPIQAILFSLFSLLFYQMADVGELPGIAVGGTFLLGLFIAGLWWRVRQPIGTPWLETLRSGITTVPLFGLIVATINTIIAGNIPGIFIAPSLLFTALVFAYRYLTRVPHLASLSLAAILLANGLLVILTIQTFAALIFN
jgi:hypothetical protein